MSKFFKFFTFKTSAELGSRKLPEPAQPKYKKDHVLDSYQQRLIETLNFEQDVVNGFFSRLREVFEAAGLEALLDGRNDKLDITRDKSTIHVRMGWKVADGTMVLEAKSQGYYIPDILPENFVDWTKDASKWAAQNEFTLAFTDGDTVHKSNFTVPVALEVKGNLFPTWFVEIMGPVARKK